MLLHVELEARQHDAVALPVRPAHKARVLAVVRDLVGLIRKPLRDTLVSRKPQIAAFRVTEQRAIGGINPVHGAVKDPGSTQKGEILGLGGAFPRIPIMIYLVLVVLEHITRSGSVES